MVPDAPSSSDWEVDQLVDSNLVENPGWFEGRLILTILRKKSASNMLVGLESLLMSNIAKCSWNLE